MKEPRKSKSKGFFAADIHQFERIALHHLGLEEAAAYLCLLKSTDQSNVTSSGGINSIMTYSGLRRAEAEKAVQRLEERGLLSSLTVERKRARTVPRYALPIHDKRQSLAPKEREVVEAIRDGRQPEGKGELNAAQRSKEKGYLEKRSSGWHILEHGNEVAFIPNSFVQAKDGPSPLARLVTHGELGPLMLAVELYHLQNLKNESGVPPSLVRAHFSQQGQTQIGRYRLHHLRPGRSYTDEETGQIKQTTQSMNHQWRTSNFWENLEVLEAAHVVEWSVYSANGKPNGNFGFNRPQRPLGVLRNGRQNLHAPESIPAFATFLLALRDFLKGRGKTDLPRLINTWQQESPLMVLENQSVSHVEGVGILRMTHWADTENRKFWNRQTLEESQRALFLVEQVARESFPQLVVFIELLKGMRKLDDDISM